MNYSPCVAPDESYLLFSRSNTDIPMRDVNLWVSFKGPDGSWGEPVKLAAPISGDKFDHCPKLSPDGEYLFYISDRAGRLQVYWVDASVIEAAKPQ